MAGRAGQSWRNPCPLASECEPQGDGAAAEEVNDDKAQQRLGNIRAGRRWALQTPGVYGIDQKTKIAGDEPRVSNGRRPLGHGPQLVGKVKKWLDMVDGLGNCCGARLRKLGDEFGDVFGNEWWSCALALSKDPGYGESCGRVLEWRQAIIVVRKSLGTRGGAN